MKRTNQSCGAMLAAFFLAGSIPGAEQLPGTPDGNVPSGHLFAKAAEGGAKAEGESTWIVAASFEPKGTGATFSPGGKWMATSSLADKESFIYLWDVASGEEKRKLSDPKVKGYAICFSFSPDGKRLAAYQENAINVWDTRSGKRLYTVQNSGREDILTMAFSRDGRSLAYGDRKGYAYLYELTTRQEKASAYFTHFANCVTFSPNSKVVAVGSGTRNGLKTRPLLWELWPGRQLLPSNVEESGVIYSVGFSPDGGTLAYCCDDGTIRLREVATGKEPQKLQGLPGSAAIIAYSADGKLLASGHGDGSVFLWDPATGRRSARALKHPREVTGLAFLPDGMTLAAKYSNGNVWLWSRDSQKWEKLLWESLGSADPAMAYQNARALAEDPGRAVPYLRKHLRLVPPIAPDKIAQLIDDLNSSQFEARQKATAELEKLGELAAPALRQLLQSKPSLEVSRRAEPLLQKIEKSSPPPDQLRGLRAIEVLEQIGTPEAREVLEELTKGADEARLTREAKAALDRLAKRGS